MSTTTRRAAVCLSLFAVALAAPHAYAQRQSGSVVGSVRDEQGQPLGRVSVSLEGDRGATATTTDSLGAFRFPDVSPGEYALSVDFAGMQQRREAVQVGIAKETAVDFVLSLGAVAVEVGVVVERPRIDTTATSFDETLSQDLLFHLPFRRSAVGVVNAAPGVRDDSAHGADPATANALLLDGVEFRDPSSGNPFVFLGYDWLDQIQVMGPGAPAEYGEFTGAVLNSVTRSGTGRHSGLVEALYSSSRTQLETVPAQPGREADGYLDVNGQIGGPVVPDRLFYFAGFEWRRFRESAAQGPDQVNTAPRFIGKLDLVPNGDDQLSLTLETDSIDLDGVPVGQGFTTSIDSPSFVAAFQWKRRLSPRTSAGLKYTGWWGRFDERLTDSIPGIPDAGAGRRVVERVFFSENERSRQQVNLTLTRYAEALGGHHVLRFGLELERSRAGYRGLDEGPIAPGVAQGFSIPFESRATNQRETLYAQDSWQVSDRLTLNPGLRLDWIRGHNPDAGRLYEALALQPRLGAAWDLAGDGRRVLKAHVGRFAEAPLAEMWRFAAPGYAGLREFLIDGDGRPRQPIFGFSQSYAVDPDIRHPSVDELVAGFEGLFFDDVRVQVFGSYRSFRNTVGTVQADVRWTPFDSTHPLTGAPLTLYSPDNRNTPEYQHLITNPDGFAYLSSDGTLIGTASDERSYKALQLSVSKPLSAGFQIQASYVLSESRGDVGAQASVASLFRFGKYDDVNSALLNTSGTLAVSRRHEIDVLASYSIPRVEVDLGAYLSLVSGEPYAAVALPAHLVSRPRFSLLLEPRGARELPTRTTLDLRAEKSVSFGESHRLGLFADVTNVFDEQVETQVVTCVPGSLEGLGDACPTDAAFEEAVLLVAPRQVTFGLRWAF